MAFTGLVFAALLIAQDSPPIPKLGLYQGNTIEYVESDGMAIVEGDIVLGPVSIVQAFTNAGSKRPQASVLRPSGSALWPRTTKGVAEIPYRISGFGLTIDARRAITKFNDTFHGVVQFVENSGNRPDFVQFKLNQKFAACSGSRASDGKVENKQSPSPDLSAKA